MRARLCAVVAVAGIAAAVIPAQASGPTATPAPKPQITDPTGDANFVNDQGTGLADSSLSGPVDQASADITSLTLQTTYTTVVTKKIVVMVVKKKKVKKTIIKTIQVATGTKVTLGLAGAPDTNTFYAINMTSSAAGCKSVEFIYDASPVPAYAQNRGRCIDTTTGADLAGPTSAIVGNSLVWTVPLSTFPVGTNLSGLGVSTLTGAVPAAVIDETAASDATFTVGK